MEGLMMPRSLRKGAWTEEEDHLLRKCILRFGEGRWHQVPLRAGLNRCRKSCRMRWLNYLKPNIKRGEFKEDEVDLILKLHRLLGNRWSLIAGRLPRRTANDVKNYWNTHLKSKKQHKNKTNIPNNSNTIVDATVGVKEKQSVDPDNVNPIKTTVFKPRPRTFSKTSPWVWKSDDVNNVNSGNGDYTSLEIQNQISSMESINEDLVHDSSKWWESLLFDKEDDVNDHENCVYTNWWESFLFNNAEENDYEKGMVECHL